MGISKNSVLCIGIITNFDVYIYIDCRNINDFVRQRAD